MPDESTRTVLVALRAGLAVTLAKVGRGGLDRLGRHGGRGRAFTR